MKERTSDRRTLKNALRMTAYRMIMAFWSRKIDFYVVGYPKTGNTWYSFMLRRLLMRAYDLPETALPNLLFYCTWSRQCWRDLPAGIPVIHTTHNLPGFWNGSGDCIRQSLKPFAHQKVILLIRDPKDAIVSLYYHNVYRRVPPVFQGTPLDMVYDHRYGIKAFLAYYSEWYRYKSLLDDILLVRYEDHRANPGQIVRKTADFLGIQSITEAIIEDVVHFSSFENMKQMQQNVNSPLYAGSKGTSENGLKTRKGKVGGYTEVLDTETISYIDTMVAQKLPDFFGYPYPPNKQ